MTLNELTPGTNIGTGKRMEVWVAICAFIALVVDGMDLQMLSLALPVLMKELNISKVAAGALST